MLCELAQQILLVRAQGSNCSVCDPAGILDRVDADLGRAFDLLSL